MTGARSYRVIRTEELQRVWHPFFLTDVVDQARAERAARIGSDNWDTLTDAQKLNAYMGVLTSTARRLSVVIGDFSGDGHGHCEIVHVEVSGSEITDEALQRSFTAAVISAGFSPYDVLCDYEESSLTADRWSALQEVWSRGESARNAAQGEGGEHLSFRYSDALETGECSDATHTESAVSLVMAFVGFDIPYFSWRVIPYPKSVVGGWNPIATGMGTSTMFGYGLTHG